mmetsp:Transcript_65123/g.181076  ORF Transcript_65123/g.181076 Transcript_65123/m.181076 type:complete len:247 (+) Transcript_65123:246-986(+)
MSNVQMQACAMGKDCGVRWLPNDSVNKCLAPLKPTSSAKPPTGTRALPVTNCNNWANRELSDVEEAQERTVRQNHFTKLLRSDKPCEYAVCCSQSSMSISPEPLRRPTISSGEMRPLSSASACSGTTVANPRAMASICGVIESKRRHCVSVATNSVLFSSVTTSSLPSSCKATSTAPTRHNGAPGHARWSPAKRSRGRTTSLNQPSAAGARMAASPCASSDPVSAPLADCATTRAPSSGLSPDPPS